MGGAAERALGLAFPGPYRRWFLVLAAADNAVAKHQGSNLVLVHHVLVRHFLGVHLTGDLPEERYGGSCHGSRYWRACANALAHARNWRPHWARPYVGVWRHRITWAPRLILTQARLAELARVLQGLLSALTHRVLRWTLLHDSCLDYHADGPASPTLLGAWDSWHHGGALLLPW